MKLLKLAFFIAILSAIVLFITANIPPMDKNYDDKWKQVDSLVSLNQPRSALELVNEIYKIAQNEQNSPQLIKANIYRIKLMADYEEDYLVKAISEIKTEIKSAGFPEKQVLHSLLGDLYLRYFHTNRYQILERSKVAGETGDDIQTWDAAKLLSTAASHFEVSLSPANQLQGVDLKAFSAILLEEKDSKIFRPTLYDFLAHRAIDFYASGETGITTAADQWKPDHLNYFNSVESFIKLQLPENIAGTFSGKILAIYQELLLFHLNDKDVQALIDVDLKRLNYVHSNTIITEKDGLYQNALNALLKKFNNSPYSTAIAFELAMFHNTKASEYNPNIADDYRWERKKASDICQEAIKKFPNTTGAANCLILLDDMIKPSLSIQTEIATTAEKPSLGLIKWKNYNKVWFRLIAIDYKEYQELSWRVPIADLATKLIKLPALENWSIDLPDESDLQQHTTEFKIPALQNGFYILLASGNKDFSGKDHQLAWTNLWITNLTFIHKKLESGGVEFFVLDRIKGTPKSGVKYKAYARVYDFKSREYNDKLLASGTSDRNGYISILPSQQSANTSITIELSEKKDRFFPETSFYLGPTIKTDPKPEIKTYFFTDRAIYRPGQTVYFKGIIIEKTGDEQKVKANYETKVDFFDVNFQLISSLTLTTNEFGSVNGAFIIPTGVLNGMMTIRNSSGGTTFNVEDYKRPTFEIDFLPIQDNFKLNTEISVEGEVKAFAGYMIGGANVKYNVVRRNMFPYRWLSYMDFFPRSSETEITTGETHADENGKFYIKFPAIPDQQINRRFKPVFSYTVNVTATDINGETQSGSQMIIVGYEALLLDIDIPEKLDRNQVKSFNLETENLAGVRQKTIVSVEVSRLIDPGKLLKERLWEQPDQFIIPSDQFIKEFPEHTFKDELSHDNWAVAETVFSKNINTATDSLLRFDNLSNWKSGKYVVVLKATDNFGTQVETKKYFDLFSLTDRQPPVTVYNWFVPLKSSGEPGEEATFLIGSAAQRVKALYEVQHHGRTISRQWISLEKEQKVITVPIKEDYRGGFTIQLTFVVNNREFNNRMWVTVPFTNKQLDLTFETFRNVLEPGGKEEWRVTVKDKKGDQVAAQMLASMFDASLEAFVPHNWNFNLYIPNYLSNPWQLSGSIGTSGGNNWDFTLRSHKSFHFNTYDRLNWFGFNGFRISDSFFYKSGAMSRDMVQMNTQELAVVEESTLIVDAYDDGKLAEMETAEEKAEKAKRIEPSILRRDFNETAFFYPELQTNDKGEVIIKFTLPESFTKWKFMALANTRDLMTGMMEQEFTATKKLMVMPNVPRFLRTGDTLQFTARITNLSEELLTGNASLEFFDPITEKNITEILKTKTKQGTFSVAAGKTTSVSWNITVPEDFGIISYRIKATAGNFSDGEEKSVPVVPSRILVTESLPLPITGASSKAFEFNKLVESGKSTTIKHQSLTLEFSTNPAWYAIQALPVISEPIHKNSHSLFAAFYANSIAYYISNANPKIKNVFESWKSQTPEAFLSNLEKNQDLKAIILEQTPWLLQARNESERKQRIALLFDLNNMRDRLDASLKALIQIQSPNGGFPWFEGMPDSRYITQNIVEGLGKLQSVRILSAVADERVEQMITKAIRYLEERNKEDYQYILSRRKDKIEEDNLSDIHIQYLYARSFFPHIKMNPSCETAFNYFKNQSEKYWAKRNIYLQGMIALTLQRYGNNNIPPLIVKSLKERSLKNEEMGMYWRHESGYYWYQAPLESQAMMIAVFDEVADDKEAVEMMKIWLLKQKQTQDWKSTRATVDAIYALMKKGKDLLAEPEKVKIEVNGKELLMNEVGKREAGTGYFQKTWNSPEIIPQMGNIKITKTDDGIAWGAMYWQYFENLDKIAPHKTPLSITKELFVEKRGTKGTVIEKLNDEAKLKIGDKVIVRIELRVDRNMEYVHMQDMRASALEPVNVLSSYKYRGGLGYYESTRDAASHFFFDFLPKGTYLFEYPLIASQIGSFSNGITTIQCMYAPEFTSHSEGIRIVVE